MNDLSEAEKTEGESCKRLQEVEVVQFSLFETILIMSSSTLATSPPAFLSGCLAIRGDRPHVTLTWAQSIDSKIAGPGGKRVMISGNQSMLMTHWYARTNARMLVNANERMRSMHDAILVGINTLTNDDPRLQSTSSITHKILINQ